MTTIEGTGDKTLVEIRVDTDGDGEADDAVTATDEHPIWVADLARVSIEDAFGANLSDTTELEMATIAPAADADGSGSGGGGPPPNGQSDATTYGDEAIAWGVSDAGDSGDAADQLATVEKPLSGQWVNAIDLKVGQLLRTSAGTWIQVEAVEVRSEHATVYNFTVADFHTYHVVAGGIDFLTHNDGCDPLEEYADSQREVGGTKFASEYTSPSGEKYYSSNKHGNAGKIDSMPELKHVIDISGHHGGCAEVGCLIQAYNAEGASSISGGGMRTFQVRNPMSSRSAEHGTPGSPCGRCNRLLTNLGISWS